MANLLFNNFSSGEVSPKLGARSDRTAYFSGASTYENVIPNLQGGFSVRPNTVAVGETDAIRLIPFVIDSTTSYQIELGNLFMRIRKNGVLQSFEVEGETLDTFDSPFLEGEINDIQYTQDYQTLYLVHKNHTPKMLSLSSGFVYSDFTPTFQTDINYPDTETVGFCTGTDCPGVVTFFMQRLWFFSSYKHPYGIWASRPFEPTNFEMYDVVETVDEVSTVDSFEEAIKAGDDDVEDVETTYTYDKTYRADNAMYLEVGSNRNDSIVWATATTGYLLIGTSGTEYAIPAEINATSQSISTISFYGSEFKQALSCNTDVLYLGKGGRRVQAFLGSESYSLDLTYNADHILRDGLKNWAWQVSPEPILYCVLDSGDLAVLFYNRKYSLTAWARWTFDGDVKSVCVTDSSTGQDVWILIERDEVTYIEKFEYIETLDSMDHDYSDRRGEDTSYPIQATVISNRYEYSYTYSSSSNSSYGKRKKISKAIFRLLESKGVQFSYNDHDVSTEEDIEESETDIDMNISGGYEKALRYKIQSISGKALTVLGVSLTLEVN